MSSMYNPFTRSILAGIITAFTTLNGMAQESSPLLEEIIVTAEKTVRKPAGPVPGRHGIVR